jgi:hypothetical protein
LAFEDYGGVVEEVKPESVKIADKILCETSLNFEYT